MLKAETSPWLPYLFPAAIGAAMIVRWLWSSARNALRKHAAEGWPTAEASIESSYAMRGNANLGSRGQMDFIPVLQYSYTVQGERYSGSANLGVWDSDKDSASDTGKSWVGEKIRIRYKPSDPAVSAWLERDGAPAGTRAELPTISSDDTMIDLELNK